MKLTRASLPLGLTVLAAVAATSAMAHEPGWYFGAGVGQSKATLDEERIVGGLAAGGLATTSFTDDDRDTGYKIFFGRQLNRHFAIEAGAFDLGQFGFTAVTVPAGTLDGRIKLRGVNLDLVGSLPVTAKLSAFARIGVNYAEAKDTFSGTGVVRVLDANPSKRDTNYKAGVGLEYSFTRALSLRGEIERYRINDAVGNKGDIDLASIGLVYRFGASAPAPQRVAASEPARPSPPIAAPERVAPSPAPTPPPVAAPPQPMRVAFAADALFDFDKSTIKPAGKQALDKFAADLRGVRIDTIVITGHTDRIGSVAYNQRLSAQRAEAVRAYLVSSAGLPAGKFSTRGEGESKPVTKPRECKGDRTTSALVACLQPDRRVEVEVTGTR